jgi:hypothetical protein
MRPELRADETLNVDGSAGEAARLLVSAQRIGAAGTAAMPVEVELRGTEISEVHRLDELGGTAVFDLSAPDWTLIVRRPPDPVAAEGPDAPEPQPEPDGPPRRRRRGGGGDSPLDKL